MLLISIIKLVINPKPKLSIKEIPNIVITIIFNTC